MRTGLHLTWIRAFRFAGIHPVGDSSLDPRLDTLRWAAEEGGSQRFQWTAALLGVAFMLACCLEAHSPDRPVDRVALWQDAAVAGSWLALAGFLAAVFGRNLAGNVPWRAALPGGYHPALLGGVIFGLGSLADGYYQRAFGFGAGVDALLTPTHMVEVIGAGLMVSAALGHALRTRPPRVGWPVILSGALTLAALGFLTLYANPLVEPLPSYAHNLAWQDEGLGAAAIIIQTTTLTTVALLLARTFELPRGGLTVLCAMYGFLVVMVRPSFELYPVMLLTGVAADGILSLLSPRVSRPTSLRVFSTCIPVAYTLLYWASITAFFPGGSWWDAGLWVGVAFAAGVAGFLVGYLSDALRPRATTCEEEWIGRGPIHGAVIDPVTVKRALELLKDRDDLAASPPARPRGLARDHAMAPGFRNLLTEVIEELATSPSPRVAEAGRLLRDYYVHGLGTHDVVAARLHLSRATFYRRRRYGLALVTERLRQLTMPATGWPWPGSPS